MSIHNSEIAKIFYDLADLLEILNENPFRIRAYRNAARSIENLTQEIYILIREGKDLCELNYVGKDLAEKIITIVNTGNLPLLQETQKLVPAELCEMMKIPSLGPKRVMLLYKKLKIANLDQLKKMAEAGKIAELKGFGIKTEQKIKNELKKFNYVEKRFKFTDVNLIAIGLEEYLKKIPGVKKVVVAGSYRRKKDTVGDLDILAIATKNSLIMNKFVEYDEVSEIISKGITKSTVVLHSGIQVDLRVVKNVCYGSALLYFTGSKPHNIAIRKIALKKHLKLNEYGIFKDNKRIAGKTEKQVYASIGLTYIEPELREDRGEIEAAKKNNLPTLVTISDIFGDLHSHTTATDGVDTLEIMINEAKLLGYKYIAITDHSKHLAMVKGFDEKRLRKQMDKIDALNATNYSFKILKAIECDILEDGSLDLPNSILKELDLTVCSIHYKLNLPMQKQTQRIIRAMDNPYFNILAHPTGRLLNRRSSYEIDIEKIISAAKERGCFLEVNAHPNRLDLDDIHCKLAKDMGVKLAISTDAHSKENLHNMLYGIAQARRGWLSKEDVINARPWNKLKNLLKRS